MKNKKVISIVVMILIVLGILIGYFIYTKLGKEPSLENIVEEIITVPKYSTEISYTCKNSRGDFTEEGTLEYSTEIGAKINLGYVEQTFTDKNIKIHYFEDKEKNIEEKTYTVDRSYDEFYRYFMINELSKYLKLETTLYKLDEVDNNIIILEFFTDSKNVNFHKVIMKLDKKKKTALSLSIFDNKDKERVEVKYSNFKK
ncbi:MAG: hypothetical protein ACRDD2_13985 [Sarcina sp.]